MTVTSVFLGVDLWQREGSISAQKYGGAGSTHQKICAWHSMKDAF